MKCFLVIDYNNTRFNEVARIRDILKKDHDLPLVLIRPEESKNDRLVSDLFFQFSLVDADAAKIVCQKIRVAGLLPVGGFVFSDRSMKVGTEILREFKVTQDSPEHTERALSKIKFREAESASSELAPKGYFSPKFQVVRDRIEFQKALLVVGFPCILKPSCEGNNRGVIRLDKTADVERGWNLVLPYLSQGAIVEQLIPFEREYSFDGFEGYRFITEKRSAHGRYPVETGQQVPAELTSEQSELILNAGAFTNALVEGRHSSHHHEIKLGKISTDGSYQVAVVEPNRRPAGMQIWDLASKVYKRDILREFIKSCVLKQPHLEGPGNPAGIASIRMLPSAYTGILKIGREEILEKLNELTNISLPVEFFNLTAYKSYGDSVVDLPKTNADFVASVCVFSESLDSKKINGILDLIERNWLSWQREQREVFHEHAV